MRYNARANITTDDDFKRDITFIRKKAQQKYIDALIKFHYRRGERNKIKLNRIKQLQSNLIVQMALLLREGVVSKETVVLRRWGSSIQKFGFINGVDNVNWPPYRDSKS